MYLHIDDMPDPIFNTTNACQSLTSVAYYPINPAGASLVELWRNTQSYEDGLVSGVLADWLEDHQAELLADATGPNPAERLDYLIHYLRLRLTNPRHNQTSQNAF